LADPLKNCSRNLFLIVERSDLLASAVQPYATRLPDGSDLDVYLPHEIYPSVANNDPSSWCLSSEQVQSDQGFGSLLREWSTHPDVQFGGDLAKVAILGFHADGVQYTSSLRAGSGRSMLVASLNVVSGKEDGIRARRFPLFVLGKGRMCKCGCNGYHTTQAIFEVLAWSFRCLHTGLAPSTRHDASPFTTFDEHVRTRPGTVLPHAALLQIRGDWEGLVSFFRLRWYTSNLFCFLCNSTLESGPLCYKDFSEQAPHRATRFGHQAYLESCAGDHQQPCVLFKSPGLTMQHLCIDSMHSADLGCFADALGSLLHLEVGNQQWYPSRERGLVQLNIALRDFYRANRHKNLSSLYPLQMTQIVATGKCPFLKAKAAQVRHLAEFGLILANRHKHGGPEHAPFLFKDNFRLSGHTAVYLDHLVSMFGGMVNYLRSLSASPFLEEPCKHGMMQFLSSLAALNQLWARDVDEARQMTLPFHLRQKAHMLEHMVLDQIARYGSPALSWCYRDEDFVGSVKSIAAKTKNPRTLESRVMMKLRMLSSLGERV
jgi:hypothetical protein